MLHKGRACVCNWVWLWAKVRTIHWTGQGLAGHVLGMSIVCAISIYLYCKVWTASTGGTKGRRDEGTKLLCSTRSWIGNAGNSRNISTIATRRLLWPSLFHFGGCSNTFFRFHNAMLPLLPLPLHVQASMTLSPRGSGATSRRHCE